MIDRIGKEIAELSEELDATKDWLDKPENKDKQFSTDTTTVHFGTPVALDNEEAMALLQQAFSKLRDDLNGNN